jgi:hypothetical protein
MDRISAIRNVEDALREFEDGEADLAATERRVAAVLRTYATEFDGEDDVFRAVGDEAVDGTVVVAPSEPAARERVLAASGVGPDEGHPSDGDGGADGSDRLEFDLERV